MQHLSKESNWVEREGVRGVGEGHFYIIGSKKRKKKKWFK